MKPLKLILAIFASVAIVPVFPGHGQEPKKVPENVAALMKRKLQHSQKILEGVALNDFDLIRKNADELIDVSKQAEWKVIKTPQYEVWSNEFRRNADDLVKSAKDKNLDGAALSYVELTLTCVKCHKYVREVRWARRD
jgi:hypothetical protein